MSASPLCVVFDANPYRALVGKLTPAEAAELAHAMKTRESAANIVAAAAPSVVIELCRHLANPDDPDFDNCLAAVCALVEHCTYMRNGLRRLRLLPQTEEFLCEPLYGIVPPILAENNLQVRLAAHYVAAAPSRAGVATHAAQLANLARFVDALEEAYADTLRSVTNGMDFSQPGVRGAMRRLLLGVEGRSMAASLLVRRARITLGTDDNVIDPLHAYNALWVAEAYGVAIDFMVNAFAQMLDGAKAENKQNSCWDAELAFLVGANCTTDDDGTEFRTRPIVLITGDGDLQRASRINTIPNCCQTLAAYRKRIGWQGTHTAA